MEVRPLLCFVSRVLPKDTGRRAKAEEHEGDKTVKSLDLHEGISWENLDSVQRLRTSVEVKINMECG
jgi:hypothetical protein